MTVETNFEEKYRFSVDPWQTESMARSGYYEWLSDVLGEIAMKRGDLRLLDIGCGEGHFTNRVSSHARDAVGVDIAQTAIVRARENYPDIRFECANYAAQPPDLGKFDIIVCSQVIYYFTPTELQSFLQNIYDALDADGSVVIVANCSGGAYFEPDEFLAICEGAFDTQKCAEYEHHRLFVGRKRNCDVAITVDYEVSEHGNENLIFTAEKWEQEVFAPAEELMRTCEDAGAKATFFAEMGQYYFLEANSPAIAEKMKAQWQDAVRRGHDVQVHLHTRWLPEAGARLLEGGQIELALDKARIHDLLPDGAHEILTRCKADLERLLKPISQSYTACCFRAGKYQIQPHDEIFKLLRNLGYCCDSSVWHGGFLSAYDRQPGFDFRTLWHPAKPYWPNRLDINRPAGRDANTGLLEIPILAFDRDQWCFDSEDCESLLSLFKRNMAGGRVRVMIGHTKLVTPETLDNLRKSLLEMCGMGCSFTTLRDAALELDSDPILKREIDAYVRYVRRSIASPAELSQSLPSYHRTKLDLIADEVRKLAQTRDCVTIIDAGCGTGELLTFPLIDRLGDDVAYLLTGMDVDAASIDRAQERAGVHGLKNVTFKCGQMSQVAEAFDLVICSEVLEHLSEPEALVRDLSARVAPEGVLIITTPNGFGYKELERRILSWTYSLAMASPPAVKSVLLKLKQTLRRRGSGSPSTKPQVMGTLNFENDVHIQFFRLRDHRAMLERAGYKIRHIANTQPLGGVFGTIADHKLKLDRILGQWPKWAAAGWMIVAERRERQS